jgi:DNA-binding NarL/FixJ family response regulator
MPDFEVIGYVERGDELVANAILLHPDIVTLDVGMPGQSGLNALPALRTALPTAIVVIISTISTPIYKDEAFRRGANAYVAKARVLSDLLPAIADSRSEAHESSGRA